MKRKITPSVIRDLVAIVGLLLLAIGVAMVWTVGHALMVCGGLLIVLVVAAERRGPSQ